MKKEGAKMPISFTPSSNIYSQWNIHKTTQKAQVSPTIQNTMPSSKSPARMVVYMPTEKTLYSGGNGNGLSFRLEYAENSTEESPMIFAKGIDENGNEFEQTIDVNKVNPSSATLVEMRALEAHLKLDKGNGLSSFPLSMANMGLQEKGNFFNAFKDEIFNLSTLKQFQTAQRYQSNMIACYNFINQK